MATELARDAALISNTMLCEVARLLDGAEGRSRPPSPWRQRGYSRAATADLFSLIDALALHDKLYTLPAALNGDAEELALRRVLIARGIVAELDTTAFHDDIAHAIVAGLARVEAPSVRDSPPDGPEHFGKLSEFRRDELARFFTLGDRERRHHRPRLDDTYDYFDRSSSAAVALRAESYEGCAQTLVRWIEYASSGAYEHCTSIVRDIYYIFAAETVGLPYWPQSTRRAFAAKFPNYFDRAYLLQLYEQLSRAFETTVAEVVDDHIQDVAFVPPFAALVLDRARNREDIPLRILEVRDEYADLRRKLAAIEAERRQAATIGARLKLRKAQRHLLNEVASAFDRPSLVNLEGVVRYVPDAIQAAAKPMDPTAYKANLLLLPAEKLVAWWRRRPIARLFDLADRLKEIRGYDRLLEKFCLGPPSAG